MTDVEYIKVSTKAKAKNKSNTKGKKEPKKEKTKSKAKASAEVVIKLGRNGKKKKSSKPSQPKQPQQIIINNAPASVPLSDQILAQQALRQTEQLNAVNRAQLSQAQPQGVNPSAPFMASVQEVQGDIPVVASTQTDFEIAQTNRTNTINNLRRESGEEISEMQQLARAQFPPEVAQQYVDHLEAVRQSQQAQYDAMISGNNTPQTPQTQKPMSWTIPTETEEPKEGTPQPTPKAEDMPSVSNPMFEGDEAEEASPSVKDRVANIEGVKEEQEEQIKLTPAQQRRRKQLYAIQEKNPDYAKNLYDLYVSKFNIRKSGKQPTKIPTLINNIIKFEEQFGQLDE